MIPGACERAFDEGIIPQVLGAMDCRTRGLAQAGYESLTGMASPFQAALTALLTVYIAVLGYRLLFGAGDVRLTDTPGIALKIGAIVALVTNWSLFQTLVFDIIAHAPLQLATLIAEPVSAGYGANPVVALQRVHDLLSAAAQGFGKLAGPMAQPYASPEAAAAKSLVGAAEAIFAGSAGVMAVATLAVGVLTATGPIFVALFLFRQTRGLFVGWVRAMLAAAFAPFAAWISAALMLATLEPSLAALVEQMRDQKLEPATAATVSGIVFVFAAGEVALLIAGLVIAMGFKLNLSSASPRSGVNVSNLQSSNLQDSQTLVSRPERLAQALRVAASAPATTRGAWSASGATAAARGERTVGGFEARDGLARRPRPRARALGGAVE